MYRHFRSKVTVFQEGAESLPRCNFCIVHMPAGQIIKHKRTAICDKNIQMWWRRRDVEIPDKCFEAIFSLTGEDDTECIEGVEVFKCLGRLMDRSVGDLPAVLQNISKARQVCGRLCNILRREGAEPSVSEKFYRVVI